LALLFCWSLFAAPGIPLTHDGLAIEFVEAYARGYRAGDYWPVWTVFGELGHGSAFPILYHRLFAQLTAILALKVGTLLALKVSIPFWLTIGAMGTRRYCRFHGVRNGVAWLAGVVLMSAPYTVGDWFVRGASAELTGFMLLPWGLRYASELFDRRWAEFRLAAAATLMFYAHMMTFFFFVLTASVVIGGAFLRLCANGPARVRAALGRGLAFGALLTCAIGPHAAAVMYATSFSGVGPIGLRNSEGDFPSWSPYFADPNYSWSRAFVEGEPSLEIGRWCLLTLGVLLLLSPGARRAVWRRAGGLALLALWFVAVQHKGMAFWFDLVPGASKIQFPSRLLVFVVTITITCMAIAVEAALRSPALLVRLVATVLPFLAATCQGNIARGTQSAIWEHNVERKELDTSLSADNDVLAKKLSVYTSWDVFLPRRHGSYPPAEAFLAASDGCRITSPTLTQGLPVSEVKNNAAGSITFTTVGKDCTVKLDQVQSVLLRVDLSKPGWVHEASNALILIEAPSDGTVVRIHERGILDLARKFLIEKTRRFP
jgi:hypothetical protein